MFAHILKMIWNRKKSNVLIIIEIAIAFMVVFSIFVLAIRNYNLYQIPLGFNYENMWRIQISNQSSWDSEKGTLTLKQILRSLKQQPEIRNVHLMRNPVFENRVWSSSYDLGDKKIHFMANIIDDGAAEDFGLELVSGRWLSQQDSGQNYTAIIVSQAFVDLFFNGEDIIGQNVASDEEGTTTELRVVGVFKNFRQLGELSKIRPYVFYRNNLDEPHEHPISGIDIRLKSDTKIIYEETLTKLLKLIEPQWEYRITSWESKRTTQFRETLLPLVIFAIVACFLIIMVAMGLFGVLWQNVTSRTHEIGLRRALGATATQIQRQIIGELLVVNLLGIFCAFVILVQLPLLGLFSELNWTLFSLSLLLAMAFMLILSTLCAYYPGKMATNFTPAEALHYE